MTAAWPLQAEESGTLRFVRGKNVVEIDLGGEQGRFELAALAILCGAKVKESVAYDTFNALRERGLLRMDTVCEASPEDREAMEGILKERYRALTHKGQKVAAVIEAARKIRADYQGDLARVRQGEDWRATLTALQAFPHIKSRAFWICRELRRHGVWPGLDHRACSAVDTSVKLALWRTGFVGREALFLRDIPASACLAAIDTYFDGNSLPAFYQGERLCRRNDGATCETACRVRKDCLSPCATGQTQGRGTEQPFACPQAAVDNVDNPGCYAS